MFLSKNLKTQRLGYYYPKVKIFNITFFYSSTEFSHKIIDKKIYID